MKSILRQENCIVAVETFAESAALLLKLGFSVDRALHSADHSGWVSLAQVIIATILWLLKLIAAKRTKPAPRPDPLARFKKLQRATTCPFARPARLRGGTVRSDCQVEDEVRSLAPKLVKLTQIAREQRLDGFVIEVLGTGRISNLQAFARTFDQILRQLSKIDPANGGCFTGDVLAPRWQFKFNGTRFFITTFAPFYSATHPRQSRSPDAAFIYLQPEFSFDHHGVHAGNPDRAQVKGNIRRAFAKAGTPYDVALVEQPHEALKYVKPLKIDDAPVRWWEGDGQQ